MKSAILLSSVAVIFLCTQARTEAAISYVVPAGTAGTQAFDGAYGMDFNVTGAAGIRVTRLGAFDSLQDGIAGTVTVGIFDRNTTNLVGSSLVFTGGAGTVVDGSRFLNLTTPIDLPLGFEGSIVAQGYATETAGNVGTGSTAGTTNDGGGLISFVGDSRFGDAGVFGYPGTVDGGPANRYQAGTFDFQEIPEPSAAVLFVGCVALLGLYRRRKC